MAKKIFFIFGLLVSFCYTANAKYLIRIIYNYKVWSGHGVEMYFSEDDLGVLLSRINQIDTLTERNLLAAFILPMDERNHSMDICQRDDKRVGDLLRFFQKEKTKCIYNESDRHKIVIKIIKADYSHCYYRPEVGFPCDCSFSNEAVLLNIPKPTRWRTGDRKHLKAIKKQLQKLISPRSA